MFDINTFFPEDIFQDTSAKYPLENFNGLFFLQGNVEMTVLERNNLYKDIIGLIMTNNSKVIRVVEIRGNKLIVIDKFKAPTGNHENITITLEVKDRKLLKCTITTLSKNEWSFNVTVENTNDINTMTQVSGYLCNLQDNFKWNEKAQQVLQELSVACLFMARNFINNQFKEHGVLYPDNFTLFNTTTKQIVQLIKTDKDYIVKSITSKK